MNEEEDIRGGATDEQINQAYKEAKINEQKDPRTDEKFLEERAKQKQAEEDDIVQDDLPETDKLESRGYKGNRESARQRQIRLRQRALADRDKEGSTVTRSPGQVFTGGKDTVEVPDRDMRTGQLIPNETELDQFGNPVSNLRFGAGLLVEIFGNVGLDALQAASTLTGPAGLAATTSLQSGGSAFFNYLNQKIRGEKTINQGEMAAASAASLIPGLAPFKAATRAGRFYKGVLRGGTTGVIDVTGTKLGRGEEVTPTDLAAGFTMGGTIGSIYGIKDGGEAFKALKNKVNTGKALILDEIAPQVNPDGTISRRIVPEEPLEPATFFESRGRPKGSRQGIPNNPEQSAAMEAAGQTNIFKSFAADPRLGQTDEQIMDAYKAYRGKVGDPYIEPKKSFKRGQVTRRIKVKDLKPILKEHPDIPKDKVNEYIQFVKDEGKTLGQTMTFLNDAYINGKLGVKKLGNLTVEDLTPNQVRTGSPQEIAEDMSAILGQNITVKTLDNIIQEKGAITVQIADQDVMQVTDLKSLTKAYMARIQRYNKIPAFERGHVFAAKNIYDDLKVTSLSDYKGNLEPEIARSTTQIVDGQSFDDLLNGVDLEDILNGNRSRAEKSDPDKVVARLLGTDYGLRESFLNFVFPQRSLANKIPADAKADFIDDYVEEMNIALMDYDGGKVGVHTLDFIRAAVLKTILPKYETLNDELVEGLITVTNKATGRDMAAEVNEALTRNLVNPQEIRRAGDAR